MYTTPKITMNKAEKITITKHFLGEYECVLMYEKMDNEGKPILFAIMEYMSDVTYYDEKTYILINYVDGSTRGIYPCDYHKETWEEVLEEYFSNPNDFYYVYKRAEDYTVNEEYNFK